VTPPLRVAPANAVASACVQAAADVDPVVETSGLEKVYQGKVTVPVLRGVDLRVLPGEFVAVMGQSGSGKSTLLNILGCLDRPTGGTVRICGADTSRLDDTQLAHLRSETIGFVFQAHFLLEEFTCLENALMPVLIRHRRVRAEDRARVLALLRRVGIDDQRDKTPDTMSGGQNQRCALVRALANEPRLILADEPTGNLDSRSGAEVFALLREVSRETGVAVVMVTHDDRLARAADRILRIEDGQIQEIELAESDGAAGIRIRQ